VEILTFSNLPHPASPVVKPRVHTHIALHNHLKISKYDMCWGNLTKLRKTSSSLWDHIFMGILASETVKQKKKKKKDWILNLFFQLSSLTRSCSMNFSLNLLCSSLNSSTCLAFSANDFWACNNCSSFESTDAYKIHPQKPHQSVSPLLDLCCCRSWGTARLYTLYRRTVFNRATTLVLSMWPCKLTLDEEKSKHASLAQQNSSGPAVLHSLLRLVKGTVEPNTCQRRV